MIFCYRVFVGLFFLFFFLNLNEASAQLDTIHRIPPLHARDAGDIDDHYIYLSTPETNSFQVTIEDGNGNTFKNSPYTIFNGSPERIQVGNGQNPPTKLMVPLDSLSEVLTEKGLVLKASEPFYTNVRYRSNLQAGSLTTKGKAAAGTQFRLGSMPQHYNHFRRNFVSSIQATQDSTTIDIKDYNPNVEFEHSPTNITNDSLQINLDKGETYVLSGYANINANQQGFVGALLESNKPVVVNSGNFCGNVAVSSSGHDIGVDQIVPADQLGTRYASIEGNGPSSQERPMVLAFYDNTEVYLNGNTTSSSTLNAGEWYLIPNNEYQGTNHQNLAIETSKPAYVYQFLAGSNTGGYPMSTPGLNFLAPLDCGLPKRVDIPHIDSIGSTSYSGDIIIFAQSGANVTVDGITQNNPETLSGLNWETYKITNNTGNVTVEADSAMAAGMIGRNASSAGYGVLYSGYQLDIQSDFSFQKTISVAENAVTCPGDTVQINFTGDSEATTTFNWDFGGGSVISGSGSGPYQVEYLNSGKDTVELVLNDNNCSDTFEQALTIHDPQSGKGEMSNVSVEEDSVVRVKIAGDSISYVDAYEIQRKQGNGNFTFVDSIAQPANPEDTFTIYDTVATTQDQLCYKVLTHRPCTLVQTSDTFCAALLSGQEQNRTNLLTWKSFQGYGVDSQYVLKARGATYDTLARINGMDTSYTDTGLACNVPQTYKILSFEQGGSRQTLSDTTTLTPYDTVPPSPPAMNRASVQSPDSVMVSFDTISDDQVDRYIVYSSESGAAYQPFDTLFAPFTAPLITYETGVYTDSFDYCYYVKAVDSCSDVLSAPSDTHCLIAPEGSAGNLSSELSWKAYQGFVVDEYVIEKKEGVAWQSLDTINGGDTSYIDSQQLRCNQAYEYRIKGLNQGGTLTTISGKTLITPFDTVAPPNVNIRNATVQNSDSIQLTFDTVNDVDVDHYEIHAKAGSASYSKVATVSNSTINPLSFTHQGIDPVNQRYCYKVYAVDSCSGTLSDSAVAHCAIEVSGTPGNLANELTWHAYGGYDVDQYFIERYEVGTWQVLDSVPGNDTIYQDTGLQCNTAYRYRIKGTEQGGLNSTTYSDTVKLTPYDTIPPATPALINTTVASPDSIQIKFDTVADKDVNRYRVYYSSNGGTFQAFDTIYNPSTEPVSVTHSGIDPASNQYCYYVEAIDSCSDVASAPSDTNCVIMLSTTNGNLETQLTWSAYEGYNLSAQVIERKGPAGSWQKIDTISGSATSYIDNNDVRCNRTYDYRVEGLEQSGPEFTLSNESTATPFDTAAPPDVNIRNATVQNSDSIQLTFDTVNDIDVDHYEIHYKAGSGSFSLLTTVPDSNASPLSYTHTGIDPQSEQYCYQVFAVDSCSNQKSASSPTHCPVELSGDSLNLANRLTWEGYKGYTVERYVIERHKSGGWQSYDTVSGTDTSYKDTGLACNKAYHYRIRTEEQGGLNSISHSDSVTLTPYDTIDPKTPALHYAEVAGDSTTQLSWEPSSKDVDRYVVYRDDGSGTYNPIDTNWGRTDTTYTDSLTTGISRSYCYKVKAIDTCAGNASALANEHCTIFLTSSTKNCVQEIDLNWTGYSGFDTISAYEIYRQKDSSGLSLLTTVDSATTNYTDTQVQFPHHYCYQVKAKEAGSSYTSISNGSCDSPFTPNTPFVKAASKTVTDSTNGTVKITWKNQQGQPHLTHQKLYYQAPDTNGFQLLKDSIPLSQDSFVHTGLNTEVANHRYYLTTIDSCRNESDSTTIHTTMDLTFDVGQLLHELSWTPYEGWPVARYEVQRFQSGQFQTIDTLPGTDTFQERYPQPCNFPISYRIKAVDSQGHYAYSDTGEKEAIDTLNPDRTTQRNVSIVNDSVTKINFTGADSLDIFAYDVMRKRGSGNFKLTERVIFNTPGDTFTVYDTTDVISEQLCYTVLTQDSCLNTVSSDTFCAPNLQGEAKNLGNELSWKGFEGYPVDSQYLLTTYSSGIYDTLARLGSVDSTYTHAPLPCNVPQTYRIVSFESGGDRESWSNHRTLVPFDTLKPSKPNLTQATVQNSDSITIRWDTSADIDVDRYEIFYAKRGDSFESAGIFNQQNQQPNLFHHDTSAIDPLKASYCYYVEAIDSCSNVHSMPSDTHCVIELEAKDGQRQSHLSWTPYEGANVDSVTIGRNSGTGWQTIETLAPSDSQYTDKGANDCNVSFDYRVIAHWYNDSVVTSLSDTARAIPFDTVSPKAPYLESFSVKGPDSAEVTWQLSNSDVKQYELWLKTNNGAWENKDTVGVQTSHTFGNLNTLDSQYCTRIVAIDSCAANRSPFSTVHCTPQLSGNPGQKANLLNWTNYEGWNSTEAYYIYNKNAQNPNWQPFDTVKGTDSSYKHAGLQCNLPQHYKIEGKNDSGFTAFSDSITLTPFDTVAPDAPAINYVTVKNPDTIEGEFDTANARDLGEYVIYAKAGNQPYQPIDTIADTGQAKNQFIHTGIRPDTAQYCYRVRTIDSCAGNVSEFGEKGCPVELKGTPGNLETTLNWRPYEGFFNPTYYLQRKTTNTSWQTLGSKTDTSFNDTMNLACNATYTYRLLTLSPSGNDTSYSDTLNLTPFDTTAPNAPQLHFASANLQDEVEVKWEWKTTSAQKYFEIWRDQGNDNYANLDTVTYDSTYLDGSANPGQTSHGYFVRAIDSCAADGTIGAPGNRSTPSDTDRIMVPEVETGACKPEARLNWTSYEDLPEGTDYYKIYRQQPATNNAFQQVGTSPDTNFTDTTILDGNEYCYRMEAVGTQSGYTTFSDSVCMQPFVYPIPDTARIKRTTVEKTSQSNGEILVEWERAPMSDTFARGYYIYHRQGAGSYQLIANISDLTDTTFRHQGINTAKFPHEYRIVIYNLCLEDGGYRKVHRPVKLYGDNRNLEVALDWLPYQGFDVQKYEVQRSVNGGPYRSLDTLMNRDTSYRDSSVRCGNLYAYRIYAEGSKGHEQSLSDSIGFVAYDTIPPDRADINKGTITETSASNGITELEFEPAKQANRKGYIIYRSEDNSRFVPVDTVFSNSTNTINYSDSNLNTQYSILSYYVRSIDSCDNIAAPSDTHQLINLQAEAKNLANEVNWTAYQGWNDWLYELQRRTPNNNWATIARQDTGNLNYTDSTKNCDTLYHYRVKAINANTGGVSYSNYDTVTSIDQMAPELPQMERVSVEENGAVQVEWSPSASKDREFDDLFKKPASAPNFEPRTTNLQTTNFTDSPSTANEEPISYQLRSEDSCDNVSDPSDVHTTIHLQAEPGQEQNELTWTTYEGWNVATYEVYRDGNQMAELGSDQRSYTDVRAVCTTYHDYRIRAIKEGGEEIFSWSNTDSAQARDNTPPQAVNLTTATVVEPNEVVEVRWEASIAYDADGYEIYRSGLNGTGFTPIATIKGAETTRFRDSLSSPVNQQFCYQVRVRDYCSNLSKRSNNGCVMGIEGEATEGTNTINWDEYFKWTGNIAYYNIYKKEDSSFYEQIGRTSKTNYRDENLANRVTDFCYQVEAHHSEGDEMSRSFEICLRQPQIVHIPNSFTPGITEGQNDKFGPEGLYIKNYKMQIFNRWGEEIFSTESGEPWDGTYEGQKAHAGVYLYSITVTGENGHRKSYEGSLTILR